MKPQKNCKHCLIYHNGRSFCTKCAKFDLDSEEGICVHEVTFVEGFSVCIKCGICMDNEQEYAFQSKSSSISVNIHKTSSDLILESVLINNHIYNTEQIFEDYVKLKKTIKKTFGNTYLYAYCTYMYIRETSMLRPMKYIANIFCIKILSRTLVNFRR